MLEKVRLSNNKGYIKLDFKKILDTETAETLNTDEHIIQLRQNLDYHKSEALLTKLRVQNIVLCIIDQNRISKSKEGLWMERI